MDTFHHGLGGGLQRMNKWIASLNLDNTDNPLFTFCGYHLGSDKDMR